jgi:hypothetical protein
MGCFESFTQRLIWHLLQREHVLTVTGCQGSHCPHVLSGFLIGVRKRGQVPAGELGAMTDETLVQENKSCTFGVLL